jgi:hypothetical protein
MAYRNCNKLFIEKQRQARKSNAIKVLALAIMRLFGYSYLIINRVIVRENHLFFGMLYFLWSMCDGASICRILFHRA